MSNENRRRFLQFLAGSPLAAYAQYAVPQTLVPGTREADPRMWAPYDPTHLIKDPKEAINVFDLEPVCRQKVPPAHFGYMASGIDDEVTLRANREGFLKFQLRPRRLIDVSKVDMSVDILGTRYPSPIVVAPVGGQRSFHAEGEIATAKAAKAGNHLMILSTATTSGVEDVTAARGAARPSGTSSTPPTSGTWRREWSPGPRKPAVQWSRSLWTVPAAATRRRFSGSGAPTPASATPATTARAWRQT